MDLPVGAEVCSRIGRLFGGALGMSPDRELENMTSLFLKENIIWLMLGMGAVIHFLFLTMVFSIT